MASKKINPLDVYINTLAAEFQKIPDYHEKMKDSDLQKVHLWVAVNISNLFSTRDLVVNGFVPAVTKMIVQSKSLVNTSVYKTLLRPYSFTIDMTLSETIRLGYVLMFHKYENFVREYLNLIDEVTNNPPDPKHSGIEEFLKREFDFDAMQWYKFPSVHKIQFIANCTKHADGRCKLDNPKHQIPKEFAHLSETDFIEPTVKDFKNDCNKLIDSVFVLFNIVGYGNVLKTVMPGDQDVSSTIEMMKSLISIQITSYKSL